MDIDLETVFFITGILLIFVLIFYSLFHISKKEKEDEKRLKKNLNEEFLVDPESGTKMTVEQAESGHWIEHNNEFRALSKDEIDNLDDAIERKAQTALNYLRKSKSYRKYELTDEEFDIISQTKILTKYENWTYSNTFKFRNGILFLPAPEIYAQTRYQEDYIESQLMFWIRIQNIKGHYYLREKNSTEKLFDFFRNDDDLILKDYECFTIKPSSNILTLNHLLKYFDNQLGLEIELHNDNLFIKTLKQFSKKDINRIQAIVDNIIK